jgi:hypothetical protein
MGFLSLHVVLGCNAVVMAHVGHGIVLTVIKTLLRGIAHHILVFEMCKMDRETNMGIPLWLVPGMAFPSKQLVGSRDVGIFQPVASCYAPMMIRR